MDCKMLNIKNNYLRMKTSKYILPVFLFVLGLPLTIQAQGTIDDRNVTVEREYKPLIQDAGKISSVPEVLEPVVEKTVPRYTDFNLPLNADFNIHNLPAAELQREKRPDAKGGFARFGFGNNSNNLLDFVYPLVKKSDMKLDVSLNHRSTFDAVKTHSTTKGALSFDKYFKTFNLYSGIGAGHEYFKYYGDNFKGDRTLIDLDTLATNHGAATYTEQNLSRITRTAQNYSLNSIANDSIGDTFWRFETFAGVRSLPLTEGLRYQAELKYKVFDSRNGLAEHLIHTKAGFNSRDQKNRLGLDIDLYNLMYRSDNPAMLNFWDSYSVFAMNPYYSFERTTWDVRIGVKSSFSFIHGRPFNPSADIHAEWKAIPKYVSIYGGLTGGYDVNTMNNMFTENRYLFPDVRVKDTYTPYEFYAGIKVKPVYNLLLDAYVDYKRIDNQYFFVNKEYKLANSSVALPSADSVLYTNRFNVIYSGASLLKIGIRANYNLRNRLNIQFKGAYNGWDVVSEQYAWNKPKWEADLSTDLRLSRNFTVSANVFVDGERFAKLGDKAVRMRPKVDINFGAAYSYNNWFTVFAKVNNVINNPYQDFYGYQVQGLNMLAGAAFSF
jgi:hypothetical protein